MPQLQGCSPRLKVLPSGRRGAIKHGELGAVVRQPPPVAAASAAVGRLGQQASSKMKLCQMRGEA